MRTSRPDMRARRTRRRDDPLLRAVTAVIHQTHTVRATTARRSGAPARGAQPAPWHLSFDGAPAETHVT